MPVLSRPDFVRMGKLMVLLFFSLTFSTQLAASEGASAKQWLEKMSAAMQELDYRGVFIYRRAEDLAAMKVTHLVDEHGARELLETLTGEPRRELRNTPHIKDASGKSLSQLGQVDSCYTLELVGNDRAAGRVTQLISVKPKDEFRYGYRLWLDRATGLLLKSDLLSQQGETLEQVMFTSLELIPKELRDKLLQAEVMKRNGEANSASQAAQPRWVVGDLPKGFTLQSAHTNSAKGGFEHMVYSDGLASVSVFVEKARSEIESFVGLSRMGAVSAFGRVEAGHQLTVVGDVPEITVKTIGQSLALQVSQK